MKKLLFGLALMFTGLVDALFCLFLGTTQNYYYEDAMGFNGLLGDLAGTHVIVPFFCGVVLLLCGIVLCWHEAYRGK